jgi:hypothetical protein
MTNSSEHWPQAVEGIIGSTLDAIGRPALRDIYNAALGDRIIGWRLSNLANVFRIYQEATKDLPPEGRRFVAEKVGIRVVEEASLEDNPDLQKIWANLLAAAVSKKRPEVAPRYISVVRELSPDEALFLKAMYDHAPNTTGYPVGGSILGEALPTSDPDRIDEILEHLTWLGLVRVVSRRHANSHDLLNQSDPKDIVYTIGLTKFGGQFLSAAIEGAG